MKIPNSLTSVLFGVPVLERAEVALAVALEHADGCACEVCVYATRMCGGAR